MRLLLSRGRESGGPPTAFVTIGPVADRVARVREDGVAVITLERGFTASAATDLPWALLGAKTLSYATNMAALRHALSRGADDVIYLGADGSVLEGPRSTVVAVFGDEMISPPTELGILPGTTVDVMFPHAQQAGFACRRAPLTTAELRAADSVWLVSSITLAARVRVLDGKTRPPAPGDARVRAVVECAVAAG